jgi:transcriptional regulator with XRE-family HTH domain
MIEENLGESLRVLRERQGVSLRALAVQTGFSPSFLSQIENGQCSPSISSMERIAKALGVTLWQFFRVAESPNTNIVRSNNRSHLTLEWSRAQIEALGFLGDGSQFQAAMVRIEAGGLSGKHATPSIHDEFAFIYEGQSVLTLHETEQVLHKGDSVTIPSGVARRWRNEEAEVAQILIISVKLAI